MYILIQTNPIENQKKTIIIHTQAPEKEQEYIDNGYQKHERQYKLTYQHREYIVICSEFRKKGKDTIVLIPEYLIPGRPYPIYVYLFAIDLYSSNPNMSQREAANATRKQFGLKSFAHTTLGRALKKLVSKLEQFTKPADISSDENKDQNNDAAQSSNKEKQAGFNTLKTTETKRNIAALFLCGAIAGANQLIKVIDICHELVWKWFKERQQLLL